MNTPELIFLSGRPDRPIDWPEDLKNLAVYNEGFPLADASFVKKPCGACNQHTWLGPDQQQQLVKLEDDHRYTVAILCTVCAIRLVKVQMAMSGGKANIMQSKDWSPEQQTP